MLKRILGMTLLVTLLIGCVPNMVVDTKGRSGTFEFSRAEELTNDKQHCEKLVKDNVNLVVDYSKFAFAKYVEMGTLGLIEAKELKSKTINRNCLTNRGHSVLD